MKVALCFGGQPRYLHQTFGYWKNCILDRYQPDVFVHSWNTPDAETGRTDPTLYDQILSLYQPRSCTLESGIQIDTSIYKERIWPHRTTPHGVLSQWYSVCHSLRQRQQYEQHNNFKYDVVVRARFDWFLESVDLEINDCWNIALTPTLAGHRFRLRGQVLTGINDQFGYGTSTTADVMQGIFDHIPYLYQNEQVDFCSELFVKAHLELNGVPVKEHKFNNGMVRWWGINP